MGLLWITGWIILLTYETREVLSHGRMMDPPSRNAMWRFGYSTPVNYDDNQNWCGGAAVMINKNKGKCGICGDDFADTVPRAHEAGGMYGNGIVVRRYSPGQLIDVEVDLTANHQGTFEFKICPVKDPTLEVTQECLDKNVLELFDAHGNVARKYFILSPEKRKVFHLKLKLPDDMSCSQCVIQWKYVAANTWGTCGNGTEAVGCGPQETFINCADVAIIPNSGGRPPIYHPNALFYSNTISGQLQPLVVTSDVCFGNGTYADDNEVNDWCEANCLKYPPNCPKDLCTCWSTCDAIGEFKNEPGSDLYCMTNCLQYPATKCNKDRCKCY